MTIGQNILLTIYVININGNADSGNVDWRKARRAPLVLKKQ